MCVPTFYTPWSCAHSHITVLTRGCSPPCVVCVWVWGFPLKTQTWSSDEESQKHGIHHCQHTPDHKLEPTVAMDQIQLEQLYNSYGVHIVGPFRDPTRFIDFRLMQPLPGQDVVHELIRMAIEKNRNGEERTNNLFFIYPNNMIISEVIDIEQVRSFLVVFFCPAGRQKN